MKTRYYIRWKSRTSAAQGRGVGEVVNNSDAQKAYEVAQRLGSTAQWANTMYPDIHHQLVAEPIQDTEDDETKC